MSAAAVIAIGYVSVVALFTAAFVRLMRRIPESTEQQRVDAARARVGLVPPASDNRPGLDAAVQDECELIWSLPAYRDLDLDAGCEQLRAAIRDEQQKGEQA